MTRQPRPVSVTWIAWWLIIFSLRELVIAIGAVVVTHYYRPFMPYHLANVTAAVLQIVAAGGLLAGKNWARRVFLGITPVFIAITYVQPWRAVGRLFKLAWYGAFAILLTRPAVVAYFTQPREQEDGGEERTWVLPTWARLAAFTAIMIVIIVLFSQC
jgi:hypothetical protein